MSADKSYIQLQRVPWWFFSKAYGQVRLCSRVMQNQFLFQLVKEKNKPIYCIQTGFNRSILKLFHHKLNQKKYMKYLLSLMNKLGTLLKLNETSDYVK